MSIAVLYAITIAGGKAQAVPVRLHQRTVSAMTEQGRLALKNSTTVVGVTLQRPTRPQLGEIYRAFDRGARSCWLASRALPLSVREAC